MTRQERDVAILFITDHLSKLSDDILDLIMDLIVEEAAEFDKN